MVNDSVVDERTLREIYLTGFEIVVEESAPRAIMSAYNLVNGVYANENPHLLQDDPARRVGLHRRRRDRLGRLERHRRGRARRQHPRDAGRGPRLGAAARRGGRGRPSADRRPRRPRRRASAPSSPTSRTPGTAAPVDQDAHHALARRAAARSAVLLKNDDARLPLAAGTRVAVIGDFAQTPALPGGGLVGGEPHPARQHPRHASTAAA